VVLKVDSSGFSKWADFEGQGGEQNKAGDRGAKHHKGGENAQPLSLMMDHCVKFS